MLPIPKVGWHDYDVVGTVGSISRLCGYFLEELLGQANNRAFML